MIQAGFVLVTCIVSLWCKCEVMHILRVTKKRANAVQYVSAVKFEMLLSNYKLLASKRWAPRQLVANEFIQFFNCVIQNPKHSGHLES